MDKQSMLDSPQTRDIEPMDVQIVFDRIASFGLFEAGVHRRKDGTRVVYFEDDHGKRYMIDHPEGFAPARRLRLLNDFLAHYGLVEI